MGNMFYFLRGIYIHPSFIQDISSGGPVVKPDLWQNFSFLLKYEVRRFPFLLIGVIAIPLFSLRSKHKDSIWLPLLAVPPFLSLLFIYSRSQLVDLFTGSLVYLPLSFVFMGRLICFMKKKKKVVSAFMVPLLFLLLVLPLFRGGGYKNAEEAERVFHHSSTYELVKNHLMGKENTETKQLIQIVRSLERSGQRGRKILLCGFKGYQVLKYSNQASLYIHTLDFDLETILRDTEGEDLYILAPVPQGIGAFEKINLKYPNLYREGSKDTVIWDIFESWHLYRVIRVAKATE